MSKHNKRENGKWFEPRSLSRLCGLIVRVRVVPRRTVVGDIDRRFDNLSGSHHQSQKVPSTDRRFDNLSGSHPQSHVNNDDQCNIVSLRYLYLWSVEA